MPVPAEGRAQTMRQAVDRYLSERFIRGELADESVPVIRSTLRRWLRFVEGRSPAEWTRADVEAWLADVKLRPNTRKSMLTKLRPFVQWLALAGELERDVTMGLSVRNIPKGAPRDLAEEDVARLLAVVPDERGVVIVVTMLQVGLRCGDLTRILITDLDVRHQGLDVRAKGGRGEVTHWAPIPDEAWDVITAWLDATGWRSGPLVRSYTTGQALRPHTVSTYVAKWMGDAGLKNFPRDGVSAHALRHTCAEHMLERGAELREVQHALGQRSIRSAEIYSRRRPRGIREAMEGRRYLARI